MKRIIPLSFYLTLCSLTVGPPAQVKSESGFVLEAGEHELTAVLEKAAKFLGRNYLMPKESVPMGARMPRGRARAIAPTGQAATIRIQKKLILDAIACEEVVSQLAYTRDYLIVPVDALRGIYELVALRGSRAGTLMDSAQQLSPEEVLKRARMRILVRTAVEVKHVDADLTSQRLRMFFQSQQHLSGVQVQSLGSHVLLSGFAGNVAKVIRMLQKIDVVESKKTRIANPMGQIENLRQQVQSQKFLIQSMDVRIRELEKMLGKKQAEAAPRSKKQSKRKRS